MKDFLLEPESDQDERTDATEPWSLRQGRIVVASPEFQALSGMGVRTASDLLSRFELDPEALEMRLGCSMPQLVDAIKLLRSQMDLPPTVRRIERSFGALPPRTKKNFSG